MEASSENIAAVPATEAPPPDAVLSGRQTKIVIGLLLGVHLFAAGALNYLALPVDDATLWPFLWLGIFAAQPALLAVWTVFGSEPLVVRAQRSLGCLAVLSLTILWGIWRNHGGYLSADGAGSIILPFSQFSLLLLPLALLRRRRGWRMGRLASAAETAPREFQFTIRRILAWTGAAALVIGAGVYLFRDANRNPDLNLGNLGAEQLVLMMVMGFISGIATLPIVFCLGTALADRKRGRFALATLFSAGLTAGTIGALLWWTWPSNPQAMPPVMLQTSAIVLSFYLVSLGTLTILRGCGFRLLGTKQSAPAAEPPPSRLRPSARFALLVGVLLLALIFLCWPSFLVHQLRREALLQRRNIPPPQVVPAKKP